MRGIAREAGVDPALVHHYFEGKAGLFAATLDVPVDPAEAHRSHHRGRRRPARLADRRDLPDGLGAAGAPRRPRGPRPVEHDERGGRAHAARVPRARGLRADRREHGGCRPSPARCPGRVADDRARRGALRHPGAGAGRRDARGASSSASARCSSTISWTGSPSGSRFHHMMNNSGPAVAVSGLKVVRGKRRVIPGLDLEIPGGQVVGLLGPSGSGKSTLMRCIVGVQIVESGTVTVLGHPAGSPVLRDRVGYVTQSPSVYADLSVRDNVTYFGRAIGLRGTEPARGRRPHPHRGRPRVLRRPGSSRTSPAARSPASPSPPPSSVDPACSCSTSRPSVSTPCCAVTSGTSSATSPGAATRSSCRATSWTRRRAATGSSCCARVASSPTSRPPSLLQQTGAVDADAAFLALIDAETARSGERSAS